MTIMKNKMLYKIVKVSHQAFNNIVTFNDIEEHIYIDNSNRN